MGDLSKMGLLDVGYFACSLRAFWRESEIFSLCPHHYQMWMEIDPPMRARARVCVCVCVCV